MAAATAGESLQDIMTLHATAPRAEEIGLPTEDVLVGQCVVALDELIAEEMLPEQHAASRPTGINWRWRIAR